VSQICIKDKVDTAILTQPPKDVLKYFLSLNDSIIKEDRFDNCRDAVNERTAVYDSILSNWFKSVVEKADYKNPISCIAHGGYGREEITPFSDIDVAFLSEDKIVSGKFEEVLRKEMERTIESKESPFLIKHGFNIHHQLYNLEDITDHNKFNAPQVNSFCDSRILFDQGDFASKFIKGILKHRKVFSHLDYLVGEWKKIINTTIYGLDNLNSFNIKEDMGGLRHFQLGLRIPHIGSAEALTELYPEVISKNPEVMEAYDFLLKIRSIVHLRRKEKFEESEDDKEKTTFSDLELNEANTLNYQDYISIGEMFGPDIQKQLLESRRLIANYADIEINNVLKRGYSHDGFTYGSQGILVSDNKEELSKLETKDKHKKLFGLLEVAQTQALPVDLVEFIDRFGDAPDWVGFSEDFAGLFYAGGQFSRSLELIHRIGGYNKCIPGSEELEISVPKGGHKGQFLTSTAFGRQKVADYCAKRSESEIHPVPKGRFNFLEVAKKISLEDEVAICLALQTARTPQILKTSVEGYYWDFKDKFNGKFSDRTLETSIFIAKQRDTLSSAAKDHINNYDTVERVAREIGNLERLDILRTYTELDLARKQGNIHLWPIIDELYFKVQELIGLKEGNHKAGIKDLARTSYPDEQIEMLDELGGEILNGAYRELALKWLPKFAKVKQSSIPEIELRRTYDGDELHLCSKDFPGLLRLISGRCYEASLDISQVHAYTLPKSNMTFDVFHLGNLPKNFQRSEWISLLTSTIKGEKELNADPSNILKGLEFNWSLDDCRDNGLIKLTFETKEHRKGYLFALTSGLHYSIGANIYVAKSSRENGDTFRVFFKSQIEDIQAMHNSISRYFDNK